MSLELGGRSPHVVFADADLADAAAGVAIAAFATSAQICSAGTHLFVERRSYDELVDRVGELAEVLK